MALIGWLEWVQKTETGVTVIFSHERAVRYMPAGGGHEEELLISSAKSKDADQQQALTRWQQFADDLPAERRQQYIDASLRTRSEEQKRLIPCLSATIGDKFRSHNTPEDGCDYEVCIDNGVIGLKARAYFKGSHETVFIPAIDAFPASGTPPCVTIDRLSRPFWIGPVGPPVPIEEE
jgi:hypothetical protein